MTDVSDSMTDIKTEVETWSVDELIPYTNNPKEHPDEQVQKIASSIKNYGWDVPIVIDANGEIIKGHGRLQAAELLGLDKVPAVVRDDLTDAEAKAARIADNKTAEAPWDNEFLAVELEQVEADFSTESLGFDDDELDDLLDGGDDTEPSIGDPEPLGLDEAYEVIIECESEADQEETYQQLIEEGYECRLNSM